MQRSGSPVELLLLEELEASPELLLEELDDSPLLLSDPLLLLLLLLEELPSPSLLLSVSGIIVPGESSAAVLLPSGAAVVSTSGSVTGLSVVELVL